MQIRVDRFISDNDSTASEIIIDGERVCFGLEDEPREIKVAGETRIPAGYYRVGVRNLGGFNQRYSARFPDMHRGMLHVLDVPNFEYILIHCGNTDGHTAGCLLVGRDVITTSGAMRLIDSTSAYKLLYDKVIDAALAGDLHIEYVDNDRKYEIRSRK
jgi:hypothetical protein